MSDDSGSLPPHQPVARKGGSALAGGIIGSLLTLVALFAAAPLWTGPIVRQALLRDPQILNDTIDALRDAQYAPVLDQHRAEFETPFASSWKGAAKPDVTLVEFFDYACPYCKASNSAVERLLVEDKGLRVVYREFPILGPESVAAARLSLAASKLGRFAPFHDALWEAGKPAAPTLARAALAAGVAPSPKADADVEAELKRNYQLASQLGANGTPVFVIGQTVLNGAVGYDALKAAVAEARKAKR